LSITEADTQHYLFKPSIIGTIAAMCFLNLTGCGGRVLTYEQQLLGDADSLFRAGNYEYAKVKYDKIRSLKPSSPAARTAQYYLGYINIYYENPFASWEAALREFKLFVSLYPDDARVDEVNSWIKLLVVMQSFKKDFIGTSNKIDSLKTVQQTTALNTATKTNINIDVLTESLRNCYHVRDSLDKNSKDLENFIIDLEDKCREVRK
jgi:outer membrane protein assembly factor BamD (BamD/ComL family)